MPTSRCFLPCEKIHYSCFSDVFAKPKNTWIFKRAFQENSSVNNIDCFHQHGFCSTSSHLNKPTCRAMSLMAAVVKVEDIMPTGRVASSPKNSQSLSKIKTSDSNETFLGGKTSGYTELPVFQEVQIV